VSGAAPSELIYISSKKSRNAEIGPGGRRRLHGEIGMIPPPQLEAAQAAATNSLNNEAEIQ
jgi:hypothetical protein